MNKQKDANRQKNNRKNKNVLCTLSHIYNFCKIRQIIHKKLLNLLNNNFERMQDIEKENKMDNINLKLLNVIFQNTKMAIQSIQELMPSIKCVNLIQEVSEQESEYQIIAKECSMIATSENQNLKDNNWFEKARLWSENKFLILTDNSTAHIAEMMIIGTMEYMIDLIKAISDCKECEQEILDLAKKLLSNEEKNVEKLKKFLKDEDN